MNDKKQARVNAMRRDTAYPAYRGIIGIVTTILMIIAGLQAIGSIAIGFTIGSSQGFGIGLMSSIISFAFAVLSFFLARIWNEAAQILVDIGDAILDMTSVVPPIVS